MFVAVISKTSGSKRKSDFGAGQDTVLTVFDMSQSYGSMLSDAIELAPLLAEELEEKGVFSPDVMAQGMKEQIEAWSASLNRQETGGVSWATTSMVDGVRTLSHNKSGKRYIQGVVVRRQVIQWDENRPLPTKKRGHKSELTAVKAEFRGLANQWSMVGLDDDSIVVTGQEAKEMFESLC